MSTFKDKEWLELKERMKGNPYRGYSRLVTLTFLTFVSSTAFIVWLLKIWVVDDIVEALIKIYFYLEI